MVALPKEARVTVIRKPKMPVLKDPRAAIEDALRAPIMAIEVESKPLSELARRARSACIAICDITRPVPNGLFLRPLVEALVTAGVPLRAITILVATGLHRPNLGHELAELIGDPWILESVQVVNHDARCDDEHVNLGRTATRGTEVKLDRRFVEADMRIVTGLVEPHFMAGYSGGRKVIAPGLAHADTITTFHNCAFMENIHAANCNLDRNPLHEEQLEIVRMLGDVFALNTVIDEDRNLAMVNFGDAIESHRQAVAFVQPFCRVAVDQKFDTVVTSAAGYPLDKTYYQTVKGMVGAIAILKPGGNLVIASKCEEGLGSSEYQAAQRALIQSGIDGFLASIRPKPYADIDEWQTQMQTKAMKAGNIHLYSSLSTSNKSLTGVNTIDNLEEAIQRLVDQSTDKALAIIPEGPYVIPYYKPTARVRPERTGRTGPRQ